MLDTEASVTSRTGLFRTGEYAFAMRIAMLPQRNSPEYSHTKIIGGRPLHAGAKVSDSLHG